MFSKIYTYALIKCLYNKNDDYIDTFWPFIINVLPDNKEGLSLNDIQNKIENKFKIFIPMHSLSTIATRAARQKYLYRDMNKCIITQQGLYYTQHLESERDELRRINELLEDARNYLSIKNNINMSVENIQIMVEDIIKKNLDIFEQFVGCEKNIEKPNKKFDNNNEEALIEYFFNVEKAKPSLFKTLQDIIFGSIISTIVNQSNFAMADKNIEHLIVYLDSNIMFSLLGLHYIEQNKPVLELYNIIKMHSNIHLRVFDYTMDEMNNVLKKYHSEGYKYPSGIKIDSIYSSMKYNGYTAGDVKELMVNLEKKLWELNIEIYPTNIDLKQYQPIDSDRRSKLATYKSNQGTLEQNHDLISIDYIKKMRKTEKKLFEKCEVLFLTSDIKLARYNYYEDKHYDKQTISEIIPDKLFTNILWLKNPNANYEFHLSSLISLHTKYLYIDREVWKLFYDNLKALREKGRITDFDVSILLLDNHLQEILTWIDPEDAPNMETEFIVDSILKAKERYEKKQEHEIQQMNKFIDVEISRTKQEAEKTITEVEEELEGKLTEEKQINTNLEERIKSLERENSKRESIILNKISEMKKRKEEQTESVTNNIIKIITAIYIFIILSIVYLVSGMVQDKWSVIEPYTLCIQALLTLFAWYFGIKKDTLSLKEKLRLYFYNKIYKSKLKELEELEALLS